jgi:hypothetical protein
MVEEFDVIDASGPTPDGKFGLMMFEHRDWSDLQRQIADLNKKMQGYFSYVVDGDLAKDNPASANRPIWIRLVCQVVPPQVMHQVFLQLQASLIRYNIEFQVAHYDPNDEATDINNLISIQSGA